MQQAKTPWVPSGLPLSLTLVCAGIPWLGCGDMDTVGTRTLGPAPQAPDRTPDDAGGGGATLQPTTQTPQDSGADVTNGEQPASTNDAAAPIPDAEAFFRATCAPCHGLTGQGVDGVAPNLAHPVRDYAEWVVRNGRESSSLYPSGMQVFDETRLPPELLTGIWDFLAAQPQPTTGQALYADYCASCHGADASGGVTGVALGDQSDEVQDEVRDGNNAGEYNERDKFMPSWSESELSDEELALIQQYVESL